MPSVGSVGDAYDNAMAESFFATLECELLDRRSFQTQAEAKLAVFEFIEGFYNTRRRHSSLGYPRESRASRRSHEYLRSDGIPMRIAQHLILGGTQTKAPASIAAHNASNAIEFFRAAGKKQLLPLNAADRVWSKSVRVRKGGEHQSQILSSKRSITCPLKRCRSKTVKKQMRGLRALTAAVVVATRNRYPDTQRHDVIASIR